MRLQTFLQMSNTWQVGLIVLAIMASLVAGASPLVYDSPLSPLIVGGTVAAIGIGVAWLRKPVWALYAAIFVVFLPTGLISSNIQSLLNRLTLVLALSVWLLNAVTQRHQIVWTNTSLLMVGFLAWGVVVLYWTPTLSRGVEQLLQYTSRVVLFLLLVINETDTMETLDGLMGILAFNGWVLVIAGVGTILSQGYQPAASLQVLGTNINAFGVSLLITMSGILWQAIRASGPKRALRIILSVIYVLLAFVLVALGGSRGGAISVLATLLMFWFWKPTRPWGKLGLLILAAVAIGAPFIFSTVVRRFTEAEGGQLGGRIMLWQTAWLLISEHPWGGVGIGNVSDVLMSAPGLLAGYARYVREVGQDVSIHNPVLQVWAETGLLGILLYLSVLGSAVWSFIRQYYRYRETTGKRSLRPYFAVVSCVFVGVMLSWSKGGGMEYNPSYFLLLALLLLPSRLEVNGVDYPPESQIPDVGATEP